MTDAISLLDACGWEPAGMTCGRFITSRGRIINRQKKLRYRQQGTKRFASVDDKLVQIYSVKRHRPRVERRIPVESLTKLYQVLI